MPAPLVTTLRDNRHRQAVERKLAGNVWEPNDLVFCQPNGRPLDPDGHTRAWNTLLKHAHVRAAPLHDARHTAATLLLVQGLDARTVMNLMGWSQLSMTKRYQQVVPEPRHTAPNGWRKLSGEKLQPQLQPARFQLRSMPHAKGL
jgi:site-specific recombinase XerD